VLPQNLASCKLCKNCTESVISSVCDVNNACIIGNETLKLKEYTRLTAKLLMVIAF